MLFVIQTPHHRRADEIVPLADLHIRFAADALVFQTALAPGVQRNDLNFGTSLQDWVFHFIKKLGTNFARAFQTAMPAAIVPHLMLSIRHRQEISAGISAYSPYRAPIQIAERLETCDSKMTRAVAMSIHPRRLASPQRCPSSVPDGSMAFLAGAFLRAAGESPDCVFGALGRTAGWTAD